jgi:hypothetical protein
MRCVETDLVRRLGTGLSPSQSSERHKRWLSPPISRDAIEGAEIPSG